MKIYFYPNNYKELPQTCSKFIPIFTGVNRLRILPTYNQKGY